MISKLEIQFFLGACSFQSLLSCHYLCVLVTVVHPFVFESDSIRERNKVQRTQMLYYRHRLLL